MSDSRGKPANAVDEAAGLHQLATETLRRLGYADETASPACLTALTTAYRNALVYHRAKFNEAGRPTETHALLEALASGRFAYGVREGVNLWEDVTLAALLARRDEHAVEVLRGRFEQRIAGWQRRYARREPYLFEDFMADLLLPRKRSGPRIESYKGHGPLDSWLKQVFISIWRKRGPVEPSAVKQPAGAEKEDDPAERVPTHEETPDERYARLECAERLKPVISACVERLEPTRRTVLLMAIVDGTPQKRLAQLYGVPDYKITRLKQSSLKQIADEFMEIARRVARMGDEAVRQCIELLLARFPAA